MAGSARQSWAFTFDGHIFYVLGASADRTIVCDLSTGQWHLWRTNGGAWNMNRGIMWRGQVLAADAALPKVWLLDAGTPLDEGVHSIARVVSGFVPLRGRESLTVGALRLTASVGEPDAVNVPVRLRFSDDEGETWSRYFDIMLAADDFSQPLKFRSLGRMRAPGRLFEFSDAGGLVRIDGADADIS